MRNEWGWLGKGSLEIYVLQKREVANMPERWTPPSHMDMKAARTPYFVLCSRPAKKGKNLAHLGSREKNTGQP